MRVLALNAGSSSLKFRLFENETMLAHGLFEKIGHNSVNTFFSEKQEIKNQKTIKNHHEAILYLMKLLEENELSFEAIGHRVVHGGDKYQKSVLIKQNVINDIDRFAQLAPLHNPANLMVIKICQKLFPKLPNIAVFDTAFHQTIDQSEYLYAIPRKYWHKKVRKYGFHGISHQYLSEEITKLTKARKIITCHLGNGCSVTAINNGSSIATSMGFTPNSGLIMGTRCGDIDAMIIPYLMDYYPLEEIKVNLNRQSGLLALSEKSNDLRDIISDLDDEKCALALQKLVTSIVNYIAMYHVLLDGAEAIVFSGGMGENSALLRKRVLEKLRILQIEINPLANQKHQFLITTEQSAIASYVLKTDEELMIAREVMKLI